MKKFIMSFKNSIKYAVSIIASREFAFIYCTIGTIAQISHTYFLINNISSLEGGFRITQALMLSIFISSSLLYFTAISDNSNTPESRKINMAVTLFTVIEILINIYYYSRHLLIDNINNININLVFDFVFAVIISCLIPVTIKLYSSHIRAKEWIFESEENSNTNSDANSESTLESTLDLNVLETKINEILDKDIAIKMEEFDKHSQKFMDKFTNNFNKEITTLNKVESKKSDVNNIDIENTFEETFDGTLINTNVDEFKDDLDKVISETKQYITESDIFGEPKDTTNNTQEKTFVESINKESESEKVTESEVEAPSFSTSPYDPNYKKPNK